MSDGWMDGWMDHWTTAPLEHRSESGANKGESPELQNVKYFTQINSFQMNLPQEKVTNCQPKIHEMGKKRQI